MKGKRQQYWNELLKICNEREAPVDLSVSNERRINANLGPNLNLGVRMEVLVNGKILGAKKNNIAIRVSVPENKWKDIEKKGDITEKFESKSLIKLVQKGKYKGGRQIILYKDNVDHENESVWIDQFEWFVDNLWILAELFRSYFRPDIPRFQVSKGSKYSNDPKEDVDVLRNFVKTIKQQEIEHDLSLTSLDNSKLFEQSCESVIEHFTKHLIK